MIVSVFYIKSTVLGCKEEVKSSLRFFLPALGFPFFRRTVLICVLNNAGLEIVRHEDAGDAAKVMVGIDVGVDPGLLLFIKKRFCIGITAVWQDSNERYAGISSPVSVSTIPMVSPAQSTCMVSPGLWLRCVVALVLWT